MREFSSQFLDNQLEMAGYKTRNGIWNGIWNPEWSRRNVTIFTFIAKAPATASLPSAPGISPVSDHEEVGPHSSL